MSKKSVFYRNVKRISIYEGKKETREELKKLLKNKDLPPEERMRAQFKLSAMNRNASKTRIRNRCSITGRPRGFQRKFGICRNKLRDLARYGKIPGLTKSSW